ncbi:phage holin family protein [Novosphingobium sp. 9]|uniref:phage holin family protein n=1 Tax=Novosphingobium sp. 9 TaxID=2025349 RepID=UPI0021B66CE2|nr:phage holin family protein [Novosphingobium sp. 9]
MTDDAIESPALPPFHQEPDDEVTLVEDLRGLIDETFDLAQAEIAFQKSRAAYAGAETRNVVAMLIMAAIFGFFAFMALVVGLVIALGPLLTPWGAMATVTLGLLVLAALCALSARSRVKRLISALRGKGGDE